VTAPACSKVLLIASTGGHLDHLVVLRPWWERHQRRWVTFDKAHARSALAGERIDWAHHPTTRNVPNLVRNFGVAVRVMRRFRPDVVISTGAGVAVPFFVLAKLFGARTVYLEVYDRIDSPTLTGRLCRPLTDLFLVQWDAQRAHYPGSVVVGQLF
jgi:UDP-N-acetylglucosamine:LPS N-acetylglucosamine transferase